MSGQEAQEEVRSQAQKPHTKSNRPQRQFCEAHAQLLDEAAYFAEQMLKVKVEPWHAHRRFVPEAEAMTQRQFRASGEQGQRVFQALTAVQQQAGLFVRRVEAEEELARAGEHLKGLEESAAAASAVAPSFRASSRRTAWEPGHHSTELSTNLAP